MVYLVISVSFPSEIVANRGEGSPHMSRYKKYIIPFSGTTTKNDNDMDIQAG